MSRGEPLAMPNTSRFRRTNFRGTSLPLGNSVSPRVMTDCRRTTSQTWCYLPSSVESGPLQEAQIHETGFPKKDHRAPSHISKTVRPIVKIGPLFPTNVYCRQYPAPPE